MRIKSLVLLGILGAWITTATAAGNADRTRELIAILNSGANVHEKARACQELAQVGTAEAVAPLAGLLGDEVLHAYARDALTRIPDSSAVAALRGALERTEGERLIGVIDSLGYLRDAKASPALRRLSRRADPAVARAALLALGRIADEVSLETIRQNLEPESPLRQAAASACLLAAERKFAGGEKETARRLYDAVRESSAPMACRIAATRGAILTREDDRVPFLIGRLRSDIVPFREVALLTIREVPDNRLAAALNEELREGNREWRAPLLEAMTSCHNEETLEIVRDLTLAPEESEIWTAALKFLRRVGGVENAPTFLRFLSEHPLADAAAIAVDAVARMPASEVGPQILTALADASEPEAKIHFIGLLGDLKPEGARAPLLQACTSSNSAVCIAACQALEPLAGAAEVVPLMQVIRGTGDDAVRTAAEQTLIQACKNSPPPEGAAVVLEALRHADPPEKDAWVRVLTRLGYRQALPVIAEGLHDPREEVIQETVSALSRWPDPSAIAVLFPVVEENPDSLLRRRALTGILQLATAAADQDQASDDALIAWFKHANEYVSYLGEKRKLISGLSRVNHPGSLSLLTPYLADPEVEVETAYAIVNMAPSLIRGGAATELAKALNAMSEVPDSDLQARVRELRRTLANSGGDASR